MNKDSLGNTWFCIDPYLWMTDSLGKTVKLIDTIKRENGELTYNYEPGSNVLDYGICFSDHSFFTSKQDTLVYVTKDSIFKIDTSNVVIKDIGLPRMHPRTITYYDSAYYFFLTNEPYYPDKSKYPGMFRFSERTRQLEWITKATNFEEVPDFNSLIINGVDSLIFYPSFNEGLVFYNTKSGEVYTRDLRNIIGDNTLNPRDHCYEDGILYFMSGLATLYKLDLRTMEFITEDLSNSPIKNDTITNLQVALRYVCDDYKLYSYYNQQHDGIMTIYDLYIQYANGVWETIHAYEDMKNDISNFFFVEGPKVSPDHKKWWYFGLVNPAITDSSGNVSKKFVRSYNMDPGSSVEETEALPTVLLTKAYPNPAKTIIHVEFFLHPNFRNNVKFDIYDYMGHKIKELDKNYEYSEMEAWGKKTINVEHISTGAYYLVIDNGNEKRSIGFVVE